MNNWILGIILIAGAVLAVAAVSGPSSAHWRYRRPYPAPYYHPYYRDDYYYRNHGGTGWLLFVIAAILIVFLLAAGQDSAATSEVLPASNSTPAVTAAAAAPPPQDEPCYLEFGRYPDWESAQDGRRRISVRQQQTLEVLQFRGTERPYRVVKGPFRNPEAAEAYRRRYSLRAKVLQQY